MKKIGILDPEGKNSNPLTDQPYSDRYKDLAKVWREFPAYEKAEEIIRTIEDNQVVLIISGTGSGKTVLVPKYALHVVDYKGRVAVTLPKQITTESAAVFGAQTLDVDIGKEVGYRYKNSPEEAMSENTKLLYVTDGTIVAQALADPYLKEYDVVIVDEAHERKVQIDFLFYLLRNTVRLRPEFRFIIMSATIDENLFQNYFEDYRFKVINIGGRTNYPIESRFVDQPVGRRYLNKGFGIIRHILNTDDVKKPGAHDILFFVPSVAETKNVCRRVVEELDGFCRELYSGLDDDAVKLVKDRELYRIEFGKDRKVVVSTNVAESSITIDGIKFVIDSGLELVGSYDPDIHAKVLDKQLISHAQAKQRMGRAGRTEPGVAYHLYTREDFEKNMERFPKPSIRTSNLYGEILKFLDLDTIQNTQELLRVFNQFIEPPESRYIESGLEQLTRLRLVDDGRITELGKIVLEFQTDPMIGLSYWAAFHLNCLKEVTAVFSMLEASRGNISKIVTPPAILSGPPTSDTESDLEKNEAQKQYEDGLERMSHELGDHLTMLRIFIGFRRKRDMSDSDEWLTRYNLNRETLEKADQTYPKYKIRNKKVVKKFKRNSDVNIEADLEFRIMAAILYGFRLNTGELMDNGKYRTVYTDNVEMGRYGFLKGTPRKIVYNELSRFSGKLSLNVVSAITSEIEALYKDIESM